MLTPILPRIESSAREIFDVMCPATEYRPVTQLGYLNFHLCQSGWVRGFTWVESFASRARMMLRTR